MNARDLWRDLLAGEATERPLVDLGATSVSSPGLDIPGAGELSDFVRAGLASDGGRCPAAGLDPASYLGAEIIAAFPAPGHAYPLENASARQLRRLPARPADREIQASRPAAHGRKLVVAVDPPCPGLVDLCMRMRGPWRFLEDLAGDEPIVEAMLDWALETVSAAYTRLLAGIEPPDLVVYGDDLAHQGGPFVSPAEFRAYLAPRMAELFTRIRGVVSSPLAILVHSCGDVSPLLPHLVDLGAEALNVEAHLLGGPAVLRTRLPRDVILHGVTPLGALALAVSEGDRQTMRRVVDETTAAHPVIVATSDGVTADRGPDVVRAAGHLRDVMRRPARVAVSW